MYLGEVKYGGLMERLFASRMLKSSKNPNTPLCVLNRDGVAHTALHERAKTTRSDGIL
jgi:hypothetical protein